MFSALLSSAVCGMLAASAPDQTCKCDAARCRDERPVAAVVRQVRPEPPRTFSPILYAQKLKNPATQRR